MAEKEAKFNVAQSSSVHASSKSNVTDKVHVHWKANLKTVLDQVGIAGFEFHGVRPDARATQVTARADTRKARGSNFAEASDRAHFHVWVPKEGTLFTTSKWKPWENHRVLGKWLDDVRTDGNVSCSIPANIMPPNSLGSYLGHSFFSYGHWLGRGEQRKKPLGENVVGHVGFRPL